MPSVPRHLLIVAPNWLGDAVMALPVIRALAHAWPETQVTVAARRAVAPLYTMVPAVHATVVLEGRGGRMPIAGLLRDARRLAQGGFDAALLLPNSLAAAWLIWRAGIPERWGFRRDLRGPLLTRAIARPRDYGHQVEYYQALLGALDIPTDGPHAAIAVPAAAEAQAATLFETAGLPTGTPYVVLAPGAAYGRAKQWPPDRFAALARGLAARRLATVLVGAAGDLEPCRIVARQSAAVDLCGRTDLPTLAAVLKGGQAVVSNDSGAMHLAAATGVRVVALFGPTNERRTAPLTASAAAPAPAVVATDVWCRPCMLRECPIDHRCMRRLAPERVAEAVLLS